MSRATPYTLGIFSNVLSETPSFVRDVTNEGVDWRRSIRSLGGPWQGNFSIVGDIEDLKDFFYTWLAYDLQERVGGARTWRGIVYELDLIYGGVTRRRSMADISNRVRVAYTGPLSNKKETEWTQLDLSLSYYGQIDGEFYFDQILEHTANAHRDRMLLKHAWPIPKTVAIAPPDEPRLEVLCRGYAQTMDFRFITETTEFAEQIGLVSYDDDGKAFLRDTGQDFSPYETTTGTAVYSAWVTNRDGTVCWAYLGAKKSNTEIYAYRDDALTVSGWNGECAARIKRPNTYYIRGHGTDWITDIVGTDCEYVTPGKIDVNELQVNRIHATDIRAWDAIQEVTRMGDTGGDPWRLWVDTDRRVNYQEIGVTPQFYFKEGGLFSGVGEAELVTPWTIQPAVVRDLSYPVRRVYQQCWLQDQRDFYIDEVEVQADGSINLRTPDYQESDILATQLSYWSGVPGSEEFRRKKDIPLQYRDPDLYERQRRAAMRERRRNQEIRRQRRQNRE